MGAIEKRKHTRYQLKKHNRSHARFSTFNWMKRRKVLEAKVYDISQGGISLILPRYQAPAMNEIIAVEFTVPDGNQIACYGRIVSLADFTSSKYPALSNQLSYVKLGVKFEVLPMQYNDLIKNQLKTVLRKQMIDDQLRELGFAVNTTVSNIPYTLLIILGSALAVFLMGIFVTKMQDISKTEWWLRDAKKFSNEMKSDKLKEIEKSYK